MYMCGMYSRSKKKQEKKRKQQHRDIGEMKIKNKKN